MVISDSYRNYWLFFLYQTNYQRLSHQDLGIAHPSFFCSKGMHIFLAQGGFDQQQRPRPRSLLKIEMDIDFYKKITFFLLQSCDFYF